MKGRKAFFVVNAFVNFCSGLNDTLCISVDAGASWLVAEGLSAGFHVISGVI